MTNTNFTYKDAWSSVKQELLQKRSHSQAELLHLMAALELKIEPPSSSPITRPTRPADGSLLSPRDGRHPAPQARRVPGGPT